MLFASIAGLTGGVADDAGDNRESIAASRESVAGRSARSLAHSGRIMRQELVADLFHVCRLLFMVLLPTIRPHSQVASMGVPHGVVMIAIAS